MSDLVGEIDIILHENKQLREQNRVLREALVRITRYGKDGICPFGCDTPHIAQAALTATSQGEQHGQ